MINGDNVIISIIHSYKHAMVFTSVKKRDKTNQKPVDFSHCLLHMKQVPLVMFLVQSCFGFYFLFDFYVWIWAATLHALIISFNQICRFYGHIKSIPKSADDLYMESLVFLLLIFSAENVPMRKLSSIILDYWRLRSLVIGAQSICCMWTTL